mmetsp:Transcript_34722/g.82351  ORF Transcript_34722/g.82351 Transcript_34722/m.82351 type:complete len:425 (+) Transcript_34722:194-1468(+)
MDNANVPSQYSTAKLSACAIECAGNSSFFCGDPFNHFGAVFGSGDRSANLHTWAHPSGLPSTSAASTGSVKARSTARELCEESAYGPQDQGKNLYNLDTTTDEFRMFYFKVLPCKLDNCEDWNKCPYAHPKEKAARRDPKLYSYRPEFCKELRKNICPRGDACPYSHSVFETWLHPLKYRTQLCLKGAECDREVCFFAHSEEQLRVVRDPDPPEAINIPASKNKNHTSHLHGFDSTSHQTGHGVSKFVKCATSSRGLHSIGSYPFPKQPIAPQLSNLNLNQSFRAGVPDLQMARDFGGRSQIRPNRTLSEHLLPYDAVSSGMKAEHQGSVGCAAFDSVELSKNISALLSLQSGLAGQTANESLQHSYLQQHLAAQQALQFLMRTNSFPPTMGQQHSQAPSIDEMQNSGWLDFQYFYGDNFDSSG